MKTRHGITFGALLLAGGIALAGCTAAPTTRQRATSSAAPSATVCPATKPAQSHGQWQTTYEETFDKTTGRGQLAAVYGTCLAGYNDLTDTSGNGIYSPEQVLSVQNGYLTWDVHTDGQGIHRVAAPAPQGYTGQRYGRYTLRFRSDELPGYKLAFLLWPDSDRWADGELDFPEGGLGGVIHANAHAVTGNPAHTPFQVDTHATMDTWHTAQITWTPTAVSFTLDGVTHITHDPAAIPTTPMHWILQVETNLNGVQPDSKVSGQVQVDWLRIERYLPIP